MFMPMFLTLVAASQAMVTLRMPQERVHLIEKKQLIHRPQHLHQRTPAPQMLLSSYDLVVIGGGPVGVTAALRATRLGRSAILIDATPPKQFQFTGPTGLYSKALRDSALRIDVPVLRSMGISDESIWTQILGFINNILRKSGENNMCALEYSRVPHLRGLGKLVADTGESSSSNNGWRVVEVSFLQQRAKKQQIIVNGAHVLLATGSRAVRLPALEDWYTRSVCGHVRVYDSDSIKSLDFLPRSVVIIGGGIIAIEFARIFAALAADVTMVIRAGDLPNSLARVGIDRAIAFVLQADLLAAGVRLVFESEVVGCEVVEAQAASFRRRRGGTTTLKGVGDEPLTLSLIDSLSRESKEPLAADLVLSATGRSAVTAGLGLEEVGIEIGRNGDIVVDSALQTCAEGVYATGDVIGAPQLASTGISQAESAVDHMFGASTAAASGAIGGNDDSNGGGAGVATEEDFSPRALLSNSARYPIGIWTIPELAFVGLTVEAATAAGISVIEGVGRYSESIRGHVHNVGTRCEGEYLIPSEDTLQKLEEARCTSGCEQEALTGPALKLVVEREEPHVVLGVHVYGEDSCEVIHYGTTLVQERKSLADILGLCFAAVTYHELYKLAARDAVAKLQCDMWRQIYAKLDIDSDGSLTSAEVATKLLQSGATKEEVEDVIKALFTGSGRGVSADQFVKRVQRLRSPMTLELLLDSSRGVACGT